MQPSINTLPISAAPGQQPYVLRTQQLTKLYGQRHAVDHLDLTVRAGEIFGFLGPNGAGKTTTIRMILGLITPTSGHIELFGQDASMHARKVLPRVGALIETPALYLHMNARRNLRAFGAVLGGVSNRRIDEVLDLMDLRSRQKDRVRTYSLGMKQRLGIAVALLHDPDLLILDEPANGLDPAGIVEIRDILRRLAATGKTILISSHILPEIQQISDRVAIISHGQLKQEATVDELISQYSPHQWNIRVDRPAEAFSLIRAQSWGRAAHLEPDGTLITPAPNNQISYLSRMLIQAGFIPELIMPYNPPFEEIFLRLTGDQAGKEQ